MTADSAGLDSHPTLRGQASSSWIQHTVELWRRRLIRRSLTVIHRWTALLLGLVLLAVTTSGAILLWQPDYFRASHHALYQHTNSPQPITAGQALQVVRAAHPEFAAATVVADHGIYEVTDANLNALYGVDPGSGRITGLAHLNGGVMGWLANLHRCALSCEGYPGYLPVLAKPIPTFGISWLTSITYGTFLLGVSGLLLLLLALSGFVLWWPGVKSFVAGFRVRLRKGSYTRNRELHKVVGMAAVPFLLVWGLTGAAFTFPVVEKVWLAVTAGDSSNTEATRFAFASNPVAAGTVPSIGVDAASAAALAAVPGRVAYIGLPDAADPATAYLFRIARPSTDPYHYSLYAGDSFVYVDQYSASHIKVVWNGHGTKASNTFYTQVISPTHNGWNVNGAWRVVWLIFGLVPLLLAVTGVSTWLSRRRNRRRASNRVTGAEAVG